MLVSWNVERLLAQWAAAPTAAMSVYVRDDVTQQEARAAVEQMLRESELVADHEFVSKAEALSRFQGGISPIWLVSSTM